MTWLNPGRWLLYAALLAALALGVYRLDQSRQKIGYDRAQAEYTALALQASEAARAKEKALSLSNERIARDLVKEKAARAVADAARSDSLQQLAAALSSASADTSPASGTDDPRGAIASECASAITEMDKYAKELAGKARGLQEYAKLCVAP